MHLLTNIQDEVNKLRSQIEMVSSIRSCGDHDKLQTSAQAWCAEMVLELSKLEDHITTAHDTFNEFSKFWDVPLNNTRAVDEILGDVQSFVDEYGKCTNRE